jgi:uncharacterized delta-60 repeat protein
MKKTIVLIFTLLVGVALLSSSVPVDAAGGNLDPSFDPGTGADDVVYSITLQPDGKIIIGGSFSHYNGISRNNIARLNPDGSLDAAFNPGTGPENNNPGTNHFVRAIALQPDGKIIIGGNFISYNGTSRNSIARLNSDGSLDPTFDPGTGPLGSVRTITLQPDNKIIVGGDFRAFNGANHTDIVRLNSNGSLDTTFTGTGADDFLHCTFCPPAGVYTIALQPDGKIVIGGGFISYNGIARSHIARINPDGSLDTTFDPGTGTGNATYVSATALQPDGRIVIVGGFSTYSDVQRNNIARLNSNGSLDTSFDPGTGADKVVYATALEPDGKLIIGGLFTKYNGTAANLIARINSNGSLDTTFDPGTGPSIVPVNQYNQPFVSVMTLQPDGRVIIGGNFNFYNGTSRNDIARLFAPAWAILTEPNSERAIAFDSVTMMRDPFPISTNQNFSGDQHTRIMLFAINLELQPGEAFSVVTAQAEDSQHRVFPLPVEYVGKVPGFSWLSQVNVRLRDELANAGDVQVSISLRGVASNKALISIKPQ